jgi:hypothetical protein
VNSSRLLKKALVKRRASRASEDHGPVSAGAACQTL